MGVVYIGSFLRGTGRTTRTIEEALEQARAGRNVFVVFANELQASVCHRPLITTLAIDRAIQVISGTDDPLVFLDHHAFEASPYLLLRDLCERFETVIP